MAPIIYDSSQYTKGVAFGTTDVATVMKIKLSDIIVNGTISVPSNTLTVERTMQYVGATPTLALPLDADITMTVNAFTDLTTLPTVVFENNKYIARFTVRTQGSFVYNDVTYFVSGSDPVDVTLLISDLQTPVFGTYYPVMSSITGRVDKTTGDLKCLYTINAFTINANGKTSFEVPIITQTTP